MTQTEEKIIACINTVLEQEVSISQDVDLKGEGLDSLATVELVIELEDAFDIQFEDKDMVIDNFITISRIIVTLEKYGIVNE